MTIFIALAFVFPILPQPVDGVGNRHLACEKNVSLLGNEDVVTNFPGQPAIDFQHFAGFVAVNKTNGRALFYWFYEAKTRPDEKPLVLWLNGGSGCSSVGYGATQEIGPFLVDIGGNGLKFNNFSWNNEANMLFLESPIGVGFSYSNTSTDYHNLGETFTVSNSDDPWSNDTCSEAVGEVFKQYKEIDIYSLYTPVCISNTAGSDDRFVINRASNMMPRIMRGYDPCLDSYTKGFYNRPDVQHALRVSDGHHLRNWSICNNTVFDNWFNATRSVLQIYTKLIAAGVRIWVYRRMKLLT